MVLLGPPTEADGHQHRRDGEAGGGQAERGPVGAERKEPYVETGRARVTATCSRKMLAMVPMSHHGGRERSVVGARLPEPRPGPGGVRVDQNFQPRSGVATSTSTPSGSRNLKKRGGSACSAP